MTTWKMTVLLAPRKAASVAFVRTVQVHSDDGAVADDIVGEAAMACLIRWPGMQLERVFSCVVLTRGDELRPVRRSQQ